MTTRERFFWIKPSALYVGGVVLKDPLTEGTVNAFPSRKAALRWLKRNGAYADELKRHEVQLTE